MPAVVGEPDRGQTQTIFDAMRGVSWALIISLTALAAMVQPGQGASDAASQTYINNLPEGQRYRLYVLGDSFASELADGLKWAFRQQEEVRVIKHTRPATGLVRDDTYDWFQSVRDMLNEEKADIVIVALGGNDRQDIRIDGRRLERFSPAWRSEYLRRIERFTALLRKSNAAVYWVGLPLVRSKRMSNDYRQFNSYYRDIATSQEMKFINIEQLFRSKSGQYTAYGKGLGDRTRRLRDRDGIHFTVVGAKKLGQFVAGKIHRDIHEALSNASVN